MSERVLALATGRSYHDLDDNAQMGVETIRKTCEQFCESIVDIFRSTDLNRRPTVQELNNIERSYNKIGFPGCIGAVDCCKLIWKNCPKEQMGQYYNPKDLKVAVISVEAWCDHDLYIWHWFAGRPGTNNDITMLDTSHLFMDVITGAYKIELINEYELLTMEREHVRRRLAYYLVDGI